jgi:hypothetical protein
MSDEADWGASQTLPLEIAQIVWLHALTMDEGGDPADHMELVQLAGNDQSVLEHAHSHGVARQQTSDDPGVDGAVRSIAGAIGLLNPMASALHSAPETAQPEVLTSHARTTTIRR